MYLHSPPQILRRLCKSIVWNVPTDEKALYLTFDDGPTPAVTGQVLDVLKRFEAKATFFCIGKQVERYPALFGRIISEGHAVGNHGYNHLNGRKHPFLHYMNDVEKGAGLTGSSLFRPPYGSLTIRQYRHLKKMFRIIMWDVLSGDFDEQRSGEQCLQSVIQYAGKGSIVTMHDSRKARKNLFFALPGILKHFTEQGYHFPPLADTP